MCSQLIPLSAPTCKLLHSIGSFSSCSRSTRTVVFHFKITLRRAMARKPRSHLSSLASGLLRNTRQRIFHASGARHSPLYRFSNQCVTSYTISVGKHCSICHQAVGGPVPSCTENPVDCDLYRSVLKSGQAVTTTSLVTNPTGLDLRLLHFVITAFFTVSSNLLCSSVDPEFRDHGL